MRRSQDLESTTIVARGTVAALIVLGGLAAEVHAATLLASNIPGQLIATGAATAVGPTAQWLAGLAFDPNTNTLYGADIVTEQLVTINTSTGVGSAVGPLGSPAVTGLAFDADVNVLYGVDGRTDSFLTIDTTTGAATVVGALGFGNVSGLAIVPEPATSVLAAMGLLALVLGWRRRRTG